MGIPTVSYSNIYGKLASYYWKVSLKHSYSYPGFRTTGSLSVLYNDESLLLFYTKGGKGGGPELKIALFFQSFP